jgi:hypothetical protein
MSKACYNGVPNWLGCAGGEEGAGGGESGSDDVAAAEEEEEDGPGALMGSDTEVRGSAAVHASTFAGTLAKHAVGYPAFLIDVAGSAQHSTSHHIPSAGGQ